MKKIDYLVLRAFILPFLATLLLTSFVLLMQFMWKYIDELVGKGLGFSVIMEFLFYATLISIPLALPLSILLSSIMTFGNLGEHFELVAIKSSGISLLRSMRSMIIFSILLCLGAFVFSNYTLPVVNLKLFTLLFDIRQKQPAFSIIPGQFYSELEGYSIRVGSKDQSGRVIKDVLIYDHTNNRGNDVIISAEQGEMYMTADTNYLVMNLKNGKRYEEMPTKFNAPQQFEQVRMYFGSFQKIFDLSNMKLHRSDDNILKDNYRMMNVKQLSQSIDSNAVKNEIRNLRLKNTILRNFTLWQDTTYTYGNIAGTTVTLDSLLSFTNDSIKNSTYNKALSNVRLLKNTVAGKNLECNIYTNNIKNFVLEWHRKFTLSFACIVLFFIGAPFGAIIRKGGLGLPMVVSVVFFMIYHVLNTIGFKIADDGKLTPFWGMWIGSIILLPIGFYFTIQAMNDSQLFNFDAYRKAIITLKNKLKWVK